MTSVDDGRDGDAPSDATPGEPTPGAPADRPDDPEAIPLCEPQRLSPAVRYRWLVGSTVGAAVLASFVGFTAAVAGQLDVGLPAAPETVTVGAFVLVAALGVLRSVLRYRSWAYVVREESLFLQRGVFTHVRSIVPYVRVQHIDTRRSALERLFGLSSLVVYTAGSRGADVTIPGLTPERATALQSRLKRLAIESEEEDAV